MLVAQLITQFPDAVIGLLAVMIFVMFKVVCGTKNDMVMDVTFINMCGDNVRIFQMCIRDRAGGRLEGII